MKHARQTGKARAASRLSVAPMMDWTDRHCRFFHRQMSRHALLYTEMVTAPALVRGGAHHLLAHDAREHPVAVQLGGADPRELAQAARICADEGYDEINLNVGCPSDRVQSGTFGAVLMKNAPLVAECVAAMQAASDVEVSVKCRIGVDEQVPEEVLPAFLQEVSGAGVTRFIIHARKAWLKGLSPKENREVPPLRHDLVQQMKARFPALHISINGGISSLEGVLGQLGNGLDGVMVGRAAYQRPADVLLGADAAVYGADAHVAHDAHAGPGKQRSREDVVAAMLPYIDAHLLAGGRLHQITRHMLGLFSGRPGARVWRRLLSEGAQQAQAGPELVEQALAVVQNAGHH